jgi:tRNA(Ile)-lysidine synthetase-like protein
VRTFREVQFASCGDGVQASSYVYILPIPGEVTVPELGSIFRARIVPGAAEAGAESREKSLLNRNLLGADVKVRNWRAGDRFFPARTRSPKKLKELLQADRLGYRPTPADRALWPVVEAGNQIVWVRGFAAPEALAPNGGAEAVLIEEQKIAG